MQKGGVVCDLLLLTLLTIYGRCVEEVDLSRFTSSLVDLANNSLGVRIMQAQWHYNYCVVFVACDVITFEIMKKNKTAAILVHNKIGASMAIFTK